MEFLRTMVSIKLFTYILVLQLPMEGAIKLGIQPLTSASMQLYTTVYLLYLYILNAAKVVEPCTKLNCVSLESIGICSHPLLVQNMQQFRPMKPYFHFSTKSLSEKGKFPANSVAATSQSLIFWLRSMMSFTWWFHFW